MAFPASPVDGQRYQEYTYDEIIGGWNKTPKGSVLTYFKEVDAVSRTFTASYTDGMIWSVMGCKGGSIVNAIARVVARSSVSTSWGGGYTEFYYRYDLLDGAGYTGWTSVGSTGFDVVMKLTAGSIDSQTYPFDLDFSSITKPFNLQVKNQHRSYDGTLSINVSHEASGQMYSSLTMKEIAA